MTNIPESMQPEEWPNHRSLTAAPQRGDSMTFHQWLNRPVYKVQCYTFRRAKKLCGIDPNSNLATKGASVFNTFRAYPQYRDEYAKVLRSMVALSIRMDRLQKRKGA